MLHDARLSYIGGPLGNLGSSGFMWSHGWALSV